MSFIYDKTSPGKGGMIGTMYHNYHRPALISIIIFPGLLPKILRLSSQERACPTCVTNRIYWGLDPPVGQGHPFWVGDPPAK